MIDLTPTALPPIKLPYGDTLPSTTIAFNQDTQGWQMQVIIEHGSNQLFFSTQPAGLPPQSVIAHTNNTFVLPPVPQLLLPPANYYCQVKLQQPGAQYRTILYRHITITPQSKPWITLP